MHGYIASPDVGRLLGLPIVFLLATIVLTWPLAASIGGTLPGNLGDPLLNASILGWNVQWLIGIRPGAFWDAPIFHPYDDALAYSEHLIGETLLVWPVFVLTSNAVLTYNTAFVASFVLAGLATYLLIHSLTGRRDVALVFALAFTFSPFRMGAQVARLQILMAGWLPLALWAIHRYGATAQRRYLVCFMSSLTLLVLSNMYMLFLAVLPVMLLMVFAIGRSPHRRLKIAGGFALVLGMSTLLLLPVVEPYRKLEQRMGLAHEEDHTTDYSAHLASYVSAHTITGWLPWVRSEKTGDQALYPGMLLLLAPAAIVILGPRRSLAGHRRVALAYACVAAGAAWLSFGPEIRTAEGALVASSPYGWLRDVVPGLPAVRAPGRFAVVVSMGLAVIGGLTVARLTAPLHPKARAWLVAGALALICLEAWPVRLPIEPISPQGRAIDRELYAWLARQPPSALLELPASPMTAQVRNAELFHQFATLQHPHVLVNGYSGFNPPMAELLEGEDSPFIDPERIPEGVALLRSIGVRFVVIHTHDYASPGLAARIAERLRTLPGVAAEHRLRIDHVFELQGTGHTPPLATGSTDR
jgi:hypothetical protein